MRCGRSRDLISEAFDIDLSEHQRQQLVEHLADCADCRRHHELLERGRALLQEGLVEPPDNLEWKVQLGIQRALRERAQAPEPRFGRAFWGRTVASAAVAAALVLMVGSFLLSGRGVDPVPGNAESPMVAQDTPVAEPDLSGASPVDDFEIDAFSDGYGIRTVGDQGTLGSLQRHYPVNGRRFFQSSPATPVFRVDGRVPMGSQVLHLRIVPTKLRRDTVEAGAPSDSQLIVPDSRP